MTHPLRLTPDAIHRMTIATEPWLSCDDCFDHVDAVVDGLLTQTHPMSEAFRVHLIGCSVCREEATSLVTLVARDHDLEPSRAAGLLEAALNNRTSAPPSPGG